MVRIARPTTGRRSVIASALLIAVGALLAAGVLGSSASGQSGPTGTLTFKEVDKRATFTHIPNTTKKNPQSNLQGDLFASVSPLVDTSGTRVGKLHLACITTSGARNFLKSGMTCTAIATLHDGTVTAEFVDRLDRTTVGAVTGGTGAYASASGVFVSKGTKSGAVDTITFGQ
jgi:hypothetical protein